jgi:hypothetical protein
MPPLGPRFCCNNLQHKILSPVDFDRTFGME